MAHMKYNPWEKCPKCGSSAPKPKLIDTDTLRLTCHTCEHVMVRATLDSDGRENIIDVLKRATTKTRERLISRVDDIIVGIKIKGLTPAMLKHLSTYVCTQLEGPGGVADLHAQAVEEGHRQ